MGFKFWGGTVWGDIRGRVVRSVVACVLAIALGGCSLRTSAARLPQLVLPISSDPSTFNYLLNESLFSLFVYGNLYEGLVGENGVTKEIEPRLAESWQFSPDKLRLEFTLRTGLKWSDGQPLTADDVLFSFTDLYLNPKIPTSVKDVIKVGEQGAFPAIRKLDDRRIEFTVPEPFAPFLRNVGGLPILPAHILRETVQKQDGKGNLIFLSTWGTDTDPRKIIANGPYVMTNYTPGQRVIFRRNPNYWRKDDAGQLQPYVERIVTQVVPSEDGQLLSFRSGDLDGFVINPDSFQLMKQEEKRGNYKIYNGGPDPGMRFLTFNLNKAKNDKGQPFVDPIHSQWFNNLAFRQAVAHGIDRDRMKNNIYQGVAALQDSPFDSGNPFYLAPEKGGKAYNYDPELSKKILQEGGFQYNPKGELLDQAGNRVRFVLLVKSEEKARVAAAAQIQRDLTQLGMKVDLQVIAFNTVLQRLLSRNWECYVGGFGGGGSDPHSNSNIWLSNASSHQFNQGPQEGEPPISGWEVSDWEREVDRLFAAGARELDDEKRRVYYDQFQKLAQEQLPFIYLLNPLNTVAIRDRVQNVKFSAAGAAYVNFWNIHEIQVAN
jgi:peptide/nickel transport system substrate-binding protein